MPAINKGNTTFCCSSTAFQNIEEVFSFLTSMFESPESIGRINPHTLRPEASQNAQPLFTKLHATKQKHKDLPLIKLLRRYALQDMLVYADVNQAGVLIALEFIDRIIHQSAIENIKAHKQLKIFNAKTRDFLKKSGFQLCNHILQGTLAIICQVHGWAAA